MHTIFPPQSDHPLFRYFTQEERKTIEDLGKVVRIAADGYLIRQGEIDSALFGVEEGLLEIVGFRGGEPVVLASVGPGDVLGEVSFIDDSPRSVSVRAAEETTVRVWEKKKLLAHLGANQQLLGKFAVAMSELLVERLRDTVKRQGSFRPV